MAKEKLEEIPEIDLILGINEKNDIVKHIENYINKKTEDVQKELPIYKLEEKHILSQKKLQKKHQITLVSDVLHQTEFIDFGDVTYTERTRAVIKVQDGCNQFCSYCIIPYARGRIRSRKPENVINEITQIAKQGIQEVVITGIHLASYGKDFKNQEPQELDLQEVNSSNDLQKVNDLQNARDLCKREEQKLAKDYRLIDLLEEINQIEGIERIRLGSLEPTLMTKEFVTRLVKLRKVCDHFHLSLQSGCNATLKRMNRKYTTQEFENGVELLRKAYPNVHLTTDVIVGFPGETEKEFEETYEFLEKIKFYKMHIFKYSPRSGTIAAQMPNQIDGNIKEQRSQKLIELSDKNEKEYNENYIGKQVEVLWEEPHGEYITGHTTNYMVVKAKQGVENTIETIKIQQNNIF